MAPKKKTDAKPANENVSLGPLTGDGKTTLEAVIVN